VHTFPNLLMVPEREVYVRTSVVSETACSDRTFAFVAYLTTLLLTPNDVANSESCRVQPLMRTRHAVQPVQPPLPLFHPDTLNFPNVASCSQYVTIWSPCDSTLISCIIVTTCSVRESQCTYRVFPKIRCSTYVMTSAFLYGHAMKWTG
jgi:hypothetical protein